MGVEVVDAADDGGHVTRRVAVAGGGVVDDAVAHRAGVVGGTRAPALVRTPPGAGDDVGVCRLGPRRLERQRVAAGCLFGAYGVHSEVTELAPGDAHLEVAAVVADPHGTRGCSVVVLPGIEIGALIGVGLDALPRSPAAPLARAHLQRA